jgi:hypothetical protein
VLVVLVGTVIMGFLWGGLVGATWVLWWQVC